MKSMAVVLVPDIHTTELLIMGEEGIPFPLMVTVQLLQCARVSSNWKNTRIKSEIVRYL